MAPVEGPTRHDRIRQVAVVVSEIACVIGTLFGVGVLGTRVEESSGGSLAADATLIAPAVPAFSMWSVIYLGLAAYTVWQVLPAQANAPRARATGWLAAASMVLNAAWLLVTQVGWIWVSVVVIAGLVVVLGVLVRRLTSDPDLQRPVDIPVLLGDNSKIEASTGWQPEIPLSQTLADLMGTARSRVADA